MFCAYLIRFLFFSQESLTRIYSWTVQQQSVDVRIEQVHLKENALPQDDRHRKTWRSVCEHRKAIHDVVLSYEIDGKKRDCVSRRVRNATEELHFRHISRTMPQNWLARKRRFVTDAGEEDPRGRHPIQVPLSNRSIERSPLCSRRVCIQIHCTLVAAFKRFIEIPFISRIASQKQ